jgi:membrane protein
MTTTARSLRRQVGRDASWALAAFKRFGAHEGATMAASIAFYSAFSLAPTLVMVVAIAGWFFGAEAVRGQLLTHVQGLLGTEAAAAIQAIVQNAHRQSGSGIAAIVSTLLLIVGASATFSSLNTALDRVWPPDERARSSTIMGLVRVRLVSFGLVMGIAFLLVASLVLDTVVSFAGAMLWQNSPYVLIGDVVQFSTSLLILTIAFATLLKWLPDAHVEWRDALIGAIVAAVLFSFGKKLFALYLAHAGTANAFGAAGSLAVLLMWLYFSAAVLLLGAEFAAARGDLRKRPSPAGASDDSKRHT